MSVACQECPLGRSLCDTEADHEERENASFNLFFFTLKVISIFKTFFFLYLTNLLKLGGWREGGEERERWLQIARERAKQWRDGGMNKITRHLLATNISSRDTRNM